MVLSIHSSATFPGDEAWPSFWPPVKLPPPPPLSAAASSQWSPKLGSTDSTLVLDPSSPLYSTQLQQSGQSVSTDSQGGTQIAFLDQRMALMRFDAGDAQDNATA